MRATLASLAFMAFGGIALAQPRAAYSSSEGKYSIKFPGEPKATTNKTKSAVGELKVNTATYVTTDTNVFMITYTDFPASATKPEHHGTLFDGLRDGLKGREGKIVSEKEIEFGPDKLPGREVVVDKGKQRVKSRIILRDTRVYQVAVMGTANFVDGQEATGFLDSLELTK